MQKGSKAVLVPSSVTDMRMETCLRYGTLVLVVLQTTATVLLMRYSRTREGTQYLASTAVFLAEILKVLVCYVILLAQNDFSMKASHELFVTEVVKRPKETLKMIIPSGLYTIQNNLLYTALSNLDAATYQVTYQLKILTTALFSVCLLHKQVHKSQWIALIFLTVGVALVQFPNVTPTDDNVSKDISKNKIENEEHDSSVEILYYKQLVGLSSVIAACFTSGFAGVYFEKTVKQGAQTSLIVRNIQLGLFSIVFGLLPIIFYDSYAIWTGGFFQGYTVFVWIIISIQAVGGLVVALTVKYADSILKGFATSISIILSSLLSYLMLNDLEPGTLFILGTMLVIFSSFMYGSSSYFKSKDDSK